MKELASLVKFNLKSECNIILGEKKRKMKIVDMVLLFIIFIVSTEVSIINIFNMLHSSNNEILIFKSIINLQLIITAFLLLIKIMNMFYLASDWRDMMVYPIKSGDLLLSKCILCYFLSVLISLCVLILLFSYGFLTNASISYYLDIILYEIIISAIPTIYFVLISLTMFWIITVIKAIKSKCKHNKWLIVIDLAVITLTYILLNSVLSNHIKINSLLFDIFFDQKGSLQILTKFMLVLGIIIISCLGFYFIGGNVYLTIMKSNIFSRLDAKKMYLESNQNNFRQRNLIISNVIRDFKLIMRVPVIRFNCITMNFICSAISIIALIVFRKEVITFMSIADGMKSFFVILWFLTFLNINATLATSFSREGRALNQFKVYPLESKKFLISKLYIGILTNILPFISANVLITLASSNLGEFILFEVVVIIYMIEIAIIQIEIDLDNMELKWVDIKDLYRNGHYLKILKPYFILTLIPMLCTYVITFLHIKVSEYLTAIFMIFIVNIYFVYSLKKINNNMK